MRDDKRSQYLPPVSTASTVLRLLGGHNLMRVGAKFPVDSGRGLHFTLPDNTAKGGINRIHIDRERDGTFTLRALKVQSTVFKTIDERTLLEPCDLRRTFTDVTGRDIPAPCQA